MDTRERCHAGRAPARAEIVSLTAPRRPGNALAVGLFAGSAGIDDRDGTGAAIVPPRLRLRALWVASTVAAALACGPAQTPDCAPACAPGTHCEAGQCVADAPAAEPEPAKKPRKRKKKRVRRTGSRAADRQAGPSDGEVGGDVEVDPPGEAPPPFVPVDDRKIPEFSSDYTQAIDLQGGSERPSEADLDRHFARITPKIQDCVATASRHGDVGSGRLAIKLRLLPSGKVESVSVKAPPALSVWGIVPCARKAVYDHRFPAYDGPSVGVDFAVDVD